MNNQRPLTSRYTTPTTIDLYNLLHKRTVDTTYFIDEPFWGYSSSGCFGVATNPSVQHVWLSVNCTDEIQEVTYICEYGKPKNNSTSFVYVRPQYECRPSYTWYHGNCIDVGQVSSEFTQIITTFDTTLLQDSSFQFYLSFALLSHVNTIPETPSIRLDPFNLCLRTLTPSI